MQMNLKKTTAIITILFGVTSALTGCGGGSTSSSNNNQPSAPTVNAAAFEDMIFYCGASRPSATDSSRDGWVAEKPLHTSGGLNYQAASIVSASGSTDLWDTPILMKVPIYDYRGVTGTFVTSGYGKPEWVKGAAIPTVLGAKSVACVVDLAKTKYPPANPLAGIPNLPDSITSQFTELPTLSWQSYWIKMVPVAQLSGYLIDGIELVSNFNPSDGQVFFNIDKTRYPSVQSFSICYLAPTGGQWNCSTPTVSDMGSMWSIYQRGAKPGMYVLTSTTLN